MSQLTYLQAAEKGRHHGPRQRDRPETKYEKKVFQQHTTSAAQSVQATIDAGVAEANKAKAKEEEKQRKIDLKQEREAEQNERMEKLAHTHSQDKHLEYYTYLDNLDEVIPKKTMVTYLLDCASSIQYTNVVYHESVQFKRRSDWMKSIILYSARLLSLILFMWIATDIHRNWVYSTAPLPVSCISRGLIFDEVAEPQIQECSWYMGPILKAVDSLQNYRPVIQGYLDDAHSALTESELMQAGSKLGGKFLRVLGDWDLVDNSQTLTYNKIPFMNTCPLKRGEDHKSCIRIPFKSAIPHASIVCLIMFIAINVISYHTFVISTYLSGWLGNEAAKCSSLYKRGFRHVSINVKYTRTGTNYDDVRLIPNKKESIGGRPVLFDMTVEFKNFEPTGLSLLERFKSTMDGKFHVSVDRDHIDGEFAKIANRLVTPVTNSPKDVGDAINHTIIRAGRESAINSDFDLTLKAMNGRELIRHLICAQVSETLSSDFQMPMRFQTK